MDQQRIRGYVEDNQEIGRMHVQMLTAGAQEPEAAASAHDGLTDSRTS